MKKKTKKNIKSMKGGVSLNGLFPRRQGETVIEYVDRIEGSRLPRYRTVLPMRKTIERGNTRNESHQSYLTRLRRRFGHIIRESPIKEDKPSSPDLPRVPTQSQRSRRQRQNTRSAPSNRNTKSKRSNMKLALKGSYKRRRASAPVNKRMSSRKAKNFLYNEKRKKTLKGGG
jgi:hypothetical protein